MKPLEGIEVLDLTHAFAGPFCTHHLNLLGAEITKIEPPGTGEEFRARSGVNFAALNAGKRSVALDLKSKLGREAVHRLARTADIVVENYRPGVAARLGVDYATLSAINSRLIYCSITGYGAGGPLSDMPAIEWAVQAVSGLTASYMPDDGDPLKLGLGVLDAFTGFMAFAAIQAALLQRARTGQGQQIDAAMLDAALVLTTPHVANRVNGAAEDGGSTRRATMGRYKAADRRLFIASLHQKWQETLSRLLEAPELLSDARYNTPAARAADPDAYVAAVEARLATKPAAEWEKLLTQAGIPAGMVREVTEIVSHPHITERGTLIEVTDPAHPGPLKVVGAGYRFAHDGPGLESARVPGIGEHTAEVLGELGFSDSEIAALTRST